MLVRTPDASLVVGSLLQEVICNWKTIAASILKTAMMDTVQATQLDLQTDALGLK